MNITKEEIKKLGPCSPGWKWYVSNCQGITDLEELLLKINNRRPDWARWLFIQLMTRHQRIEISIFSAKQVLHIFEEQCPNDKRPRKAIEAAEKYLKDPSEETKKGAYEAYAATYAADADAAAYAADAADAAAYAAAATYAAAAVYAAAATYAAAAVYAAATYAAAAVYHICGSNAMSEAVDAVENKKEMEERIIKEAVRILDV